MVRFIDKEACARFLGVEVGRRKTAACVLAQPYPLPSSPSWHVANLELVFTPRAQAVTGDGSGWLIHRLICQRTLNLTRAVHESVAPYKILLFGHATCSQMKRIVNLL